MTSEVHTTLWPALFECRCTVSRGHALFLLLVLFASECGVTNASVTPQCGMLVSLDVLFVTVTGCGALP